MPSPTYISVQAAAEMLGCSKQTVRRRIADGDLAASKVGPRLIRVDVADVKALLKPVTTTARP